MQVGISVLKALGFWQAGSNTGRFGYCLDIGDIERNEIWRYVEGR